MIDIWFKTSNILKLIRFDPICFFILILWYNANFKPGNSDQKCASMDWK